MDLLNPAEVFHASTAGDCLFVTQSRSRTHEWLRGTFAEVASRVPRDFEITPFIDARTGAISDRRNAVINKQTGKPVAAVSDRYQLIPHGAILDAVAKAKISGIETGRLPCEVYVGDDGARMGFRILLPDVQLDPGDGNPLVGRLEGFNSVDSTMPLRLALGFYRAVCGNGNSWGFGKTNLMRLHTSGLGEVDFEDFIRRGLEDLPGIAEGYRNWMHRQVKAEEWLKAETAIGNRFGPGKLLRIREIWNFGVDPAARTPQVPGLLNEKTAFRLYQSMTWVASRTHDLQTQARLHQQAEAVMQVALN